MLFPGVKKVAKKFNLKKTRTYVYGKVRNSFICYFDSLGCKWLEIKIPVTIDTDSHINPLIKFAEKPYFANIIFNDDLLELMLPEKFIPYNPKKTIEIIEHITLYFYNQYPELEAKELDYSNIKNVQTIKAEIYNNGKIFFRLIIQILSSIIIGAIVGLIKKFL